MHQLALCLTAINGRTPRTLRSFREETGKQSRGKNFLKGRVRAHIKSMDAFDDVLATKGAEGLEGKAKRKKKRRRRKKKKKATGEFKDEVDARRMQRFASGTDAEEEKLNRQDFDGDADFGVGAKVKAMAAVKSLAQMKKEKKEQKNPVLAEARAAVRLLHYGG